MKRILYSSIMLILIQCSNWGKSQNEVTETIPDSVVITYIAPMIETFEAISVPAFVQTARDRINVNTMIISDPDTIRRLLRVKPHFDTQKIKKYIDTRFMTIFAASGKMDTIFSSWPSSDISHNGIIYADSNYVHTLYDLIEERDSVFPGIRFVFLDNGGIIMK